MKPRKTIESQYGKSIEKLIPPLGFRWKLGKEKKPEFRPVKSGEWWLCAQPFMPMQAGSHWMMSKTPFLILEKR